MTEALHQFLCSRTSCSEERSFLHRRRPRPLGTAGAFRGGSPECHSYGLDTELKSTLKDGEREYETQFVSSSRISTALNHRGSVAGIPKSNQCAGNRLLYQRQQWRRSLPRHHPNRRPPTRIPLSH